VRAFARYFRRCRSRRPVLRVSAALALCSVLLVCGACKDDASLTAFRDAATQGLSEGFKSLFGAFVDGTFAAYNQSQGTDTTQTTTP
jgi:hypothetical protein